MCSSLTLPVTTQSCCRSDILLRPARNRCPIENIKLKLTTKSQIDIRLLELKYSDAISRSYNVHEHLQEYQCKQHALIPCKITTLFFSEKFLFPPSLILINYLLYIGPSLLYSHCNIQFPVLNQCA